MKRKQKICGHIEIKGNTEFICVRPPHDTEPRPPETIHIDRAGARVVEFIVEGDKHRMVSRHAKE